MLTEADNKREKDEEENLQTNKSGQLSDKKPYDLYVDLIKRVLINSIYCDPHSASWGEQIYAPGARLEGKDCPRDAHTMVGIKRLDNLQNCLESVIRENIPGAFLEAGVWRGGCCILAKAIFQASGQTNRKVYLADSFQGLPKPDTVNFPQDSTLDLSIYPELAVSMEQVKANFARYGLLDETVCFLPGWFKDSLPQAQIDNLAVLRLDGDLYESTMISLQSLYAKLAVGGYVIIDDYGAFEQCRNAVHDFRASQAIDAPITMVDWTGAFWRKTEDHRR